MTLLSFLYSKQKPNKLATTTNNGVMLMSARMKHGHLYFGDTFDTQKKKPQGKNELNTYTGSNWTRDKPKTTKLKPGNS